MPTNSTCGGGAGEHRLKQLQVIEKLYCDGEFAAVLAETEAHLRAGSPNGSLLNIAAASAYALGKVCEAEKYWRTALEGDPGFAEGYNNLGVLLEGSGRLDEAEICFNRAVSLDKNYLDARFNLGNLLKKLGRLQAAEEAYRAVLSCNSSHAEAWNNLGILMSETERFDEAKECFRQALSIRPEYDLASHNLKRVSEHRGRPDALPTQELSSADRARLSDEHFQQGNRSSEVGAFAEAEASYRRALSLHGGFFAAHFNLGNLLFRGKRYDEAKDCYLKAFALRPDSPHPLYALGNLCVDTMSFDEAERFYRQAVAVAPGFADARNNLGNLLKELHRFDEAEACYREVLAADPQYVDARWNLAILLLFTGRFPEGWRLFEARYDAGLRHRIYRMPDLPYPQWKGEDLRGKSIAIVQEQGFGDQIQFFRYLAALRSLGASRVTMVVTAPLKPLLERSAATGCAIVTDREAAAMAPHDFWAFPMSLPLRFGTTLDTIPAPGPYLVAGPEKIQAWAPRLPGKGTKIGLVWKGAASHKNDGQRSLPQLATLAPLWRLPGVAFVSLQKGMGEDEAAAPPAGQPLVNLGGSCRDFDDMAAVVAQLDLVICVDTAIAHLAGALGKPCWVLLPRFGTDWRWMADGADSPWYPRGVRLFRQTKIGVWDDVVRQVAERLAAGDALVRLLSLSLR